MNDQPEDAYRIYKKMLPLNSSASVGIDQYETEPYVYSEYVTSRDHEYEGQASHSWLTGSSVWMYRIGIDHIMGIRTSLKGIKLAPNIPGEWKKAAITRKYMGKTLQVTIHNARGVNNQVERVSINGEEFDQEWIDVKNFPDDLLRIEVHLG